MGYSGHVSDYFQFCLRRIWLMIAAVTAFNLGAPFPAVGCGSGGTCGSDSPPTLDRLLWLSLSRSSSDSPHGTADAETILAATPSPLAAQPIVIPLPDPNRRGGAQPPIDGPGHELVHQLALELVPGAMAAGGDAALTIHEAVRQQATPQAGDHSPHPASTVGDKEASIWITQEFHLPQHNGLSPGLPPHVSSNVFGGLPHGAITAPVTMQMICGAGGANGAIHRFSGHATLRFDPHDPAPSLINDIRLKSATGARASGRLSFGDQGAVLAGVLADPDGQLDLVVDGEVLSFTADVALWHQVKEVSGGFAAVPAPDLPHIGGIIGYFSEAR